MKKNLLTVGALVSALVMQAQVLTYVGNDARLTLLTDALMYSGGGIQTAGTGIVDNSGNIMMVGGPFLTTQADGTTAKTDGGNFILRLTDRTNYSSYGQFFITGSSGPIAQSELTGIVSKEYLAPNQGDYQQLSLPFYKKDFSTLNTNPTELGANALTQARWTQTEILNWDNRNVKSDHLPLWGNTTMLTPTNNNSGVPTTTKSTSYYMVGAKNWDANAGKTAAKNLDPSATPYNVFTIEGVPVADGISETMANAGAGINYGGGWATNVYRERYYTYFGDQWVAAGWADPAYGRNIYQYGNPFFTNLDLSQIVGNDGGATITDGNNITNLIGVRYDATSVVWSKVDGTAPNSTTSYVTFANGTPVGDPVPVIKPMGVFVLKLSDNTTQTLNFDTLRRFKNTLRSAGTSYDVTAKAVKASTFGRTAAAPLAATMSKNGNAYVKQIGLVALDGSGQEIGRTYYAVYPDAVTGENKTNKTQVTASSSNVIGSFEEAKTGGIDQNLVNTYWLYINVANDTDFKGKNIGVKLFSDAVKSIRVELKEDGVALPQNNGLSGTEQFYVGNTPDSGASAVKNGQIIPVAGTDLIVSYGAGSGTLAVNNIAKPSETVVAYDNATSKHFIIFDKTWNKADVTLYDMSGKLISAKKDVSTQSNYALDLPAANGVYVVTAVSENGVKFVQKIKK